MSCVVIIRHRSIIQQGCFFQVQSFTFRLILTVERHPLSMKIYFYSRLGISVVLNDEVISHK